SEPNTESPNTWSSKDIWVRNDPDNGTTHQDPDYDQNPNYVYVRVTNTGCIASSGTEELEVYSTKANTYSPWREGWDGTIEIDGIPLDGYIGTVTIPVVQPGEEAIVSMPWTVPNPEDYEEVDVDQPWHFCLLARIEAPTTDPMTYPETENSSENVRNNNNIASRNVTIIYVPDGGLIAGTIAIGNPSDQAKSYDLIFNADDRETGKKIFEEAEVTIKLSSDLYTAWVAGGSQKTNITT